MKGESSSKTSKTESNLASRIKLAIGDQSVSRFARAAGIGESLMRQYLAGSIPGADKLVAISRASGYLLEWLATGEGPAHKDGTAGIKEPQLTYGSLRADPAYTFIPFHDVRTAGGDTPSSDVMAFKQEWLKTELHATPRDLYLIFVDSESMEPTLRPGDMLLVDRRDADPVARDGIYALRMDSTLLLKRLQRLPGGKIKAASDNPAYEPFVLNGTEDLTIIGRVVWSGRRM